MVGLDSDFPANYVPWRELQTRHRVRFRTLELRNGTLDLEELDRACRGARLAALSFVHFLSGFRWDLQAVGEVCRRRDCRLAVDAVQGMGAFDIDVKACGIHALSASGHKWLLGPEGCAVLYVDRDWMPDLLPPELGWASLEGFESYRSDGGLQPDARRFECGTLNTVGCAGLRTSLQLLNGIPAATRSDTIHALAEHVLRGALDRGYTAAARRDRKQRIGNRVATEGWSRSCCDGPSTAGGRCLGLRQAGLDPRGTAHLQHARSGREAARTPPVEDRQQDCSARQPPRRSDPARLGRELQQSP